MSTKHNFNTYTTISKRQQSFELRNCNGATGRFLCKTSHPKCFKTTNFDRFYREAIEAGRFNNVLNYAIDI